MCVYKQTRFMHKYVSIYMHKYKNITSDFTSHLAAERQRASEGGRCIESDNQCPESLTRDFGRSWSKFIKCSLTGRTHRKRCGENLRRGVGSCRNAVTGTGWSSDAHWPPGAPSTPPGPPSLVYVRLYHQAFVFFQ